MKNCRKLFEKSFTKESVNYLEVYANNKEIREKEKLSQKKQV